jgi:hypothetical protein
MLSKFVSHHAERAKWIELRGSAIPKNISVISSERSQLPLRLG